MGVKMKKILLLTLLIISVCLSLPVGISHGAVTYTYDASLGTLPEAQGWTSNNTSGYSTLNTVDGYLNLNSTMSGSHYWSMTGDPFYYSNGVIVEATMRINSSNFFTNSSVVRSGYYLGVIDDTTLPVWTAISSDRAYFLYEGENISSYAMINLLDGQFHDFRMVADSSGFDLYIDNVQVLNEPFRTGTLSSPNFISFGDQSNAGISNTDLKFFQVTVVPEPVSSTLFIIGGATLGFRRFRKKFIK
jgi:hypothetical protein